MSSPPLSCTRCNTPLSDGFFNRAELTPCSSCAAPLQVEIFPAFFRPVSQGRDAETVMVEGESSCFYHPTKKAVVPCDGCGRFLCALCDCELNQRHYCPGCLESGQSKGKINSLEQGRTLYDRIALAVAILPVAVIFGIYFLIITAPIAIFIAIRYWKAPGSLVTPGKGRFVAAIILGLLELVGWVGLVFVLLKVRSHA